MGLFTYNFDSASLSNHLHLVKVTIFSKRCLCVLETVFEQSPHATLTFDPKNKRASVLAKDKTCVKFRLLISNGFEKA